MAVCCIDERGAWGESLAQSGIPVSALRRRPGFRPSLGARIASIAAAHRADVIHCHQYSPFVYGCLARFLRPARLVFTEHGRLADRPPSRKRFAANQVLRHLPNRVFTVSEDLKRHLVREGFAAGRVEVIYNGIDIGPSPGPSPARRRGGRSGCRPRRLSPGGRTPRSRQGLHRPGPRLRARPRQPERRPSCARRRRSRAAGDRARRRAARHRARGDPGRSSRGRTRAAARRRRVREQFDHRRHLADDSRGDGRVPPGRRDARRRHARSRRPGHGSARARRRRRALATALVATRGRPARPAGAAEPARRAAEQRSRSIG